GRSGQVDALISGTSFTVARCATVPSFRHAEPCWVVGRCNGYATCAARQVEPESLTVCSKPSSRRRKAVAPQEQSGGRPRRDVGVAVGAKQAAAVKPVEDNP